MNNLRLCCKDDKLTASRSKGILHVLLSLLMISVIASCASYDSSIKKMNDADTHASRGKDLVAAGNYRQAIKEYEMAIKKAKSGRRECLYAIDCRVELSNEEFDKQIASMEMNIGLCYVGLGDLDSARKIYEKVKDVIPLDAERLLAQILQAEERTGGAVSVPEISDTEQLKKEYATYFNLANGYFNKGRYQDAIDSYNSAIEAANSYLKACKRSMDCSMSVDDINYDLALIYTNRGTSYAGLKNFDQGLKDYKKALEYDPDNPFANFHLGIAYVSLNNMVLARRQYEILKDIDANLAAELNRIIIGSR